MKPLGKTRLSSAVMLVVLFVAIGKILGFAKQILIANYFGASLETDILNLSQELIMNIDFVISQMILTGFTAIYIHASKRNEQDANKFITNTLKIFVVIALVLTATILICAPWIAKLLAPTYDAESSAKLTLYLRIYSACLIFFVFTGILSGILNAKEKYVLRELTTLIQNATIILLIVLLHGPLGINSLIVAFFGYTVITTIYLAFASHKDWKVDFKSFRENPFKSQDIKDLLKMLAPLLIGYSMIYLNQQVDKIVVSGLEEGMVSDLSYASVLSNLVVALIASLCTIIFTKLTAFISEKDFHKAGSFAVKSTSLLITIFLPISILCVLCAPDIVSIAFKRGEFDDTAALFTAYALMGYALLFVFYIIKSIFARLQYGGKSTLWPMINSCIGITINIGLSLWLGKFAGLKPEWALFSVAAATSASEFVSAILNIIAAKKKIKEVPLKNFLPYMPFWIIGGAACGFLAYFGNSWFKGFSSWARFPLIVVIGFAAYAIIISPILIVLFKQRKASKAEAVIQNNSLEEKSIESQEENHD